MHLPIHEHKKEIVDAIRENQVVVVVGETGSGKTTQLPLFLYEACYSRKGVIGITEPRRIAASSVAHFVAQQLNSPMGQIVGYQVRFDDQTVRDTKIKFMTDGILLREMQEDSDLLRYSVIMVDEAHERSVNIDFTLGLLKQLLARRADLKVVVSSATIDAEKFAAYFGGAPVINVSGRTFPVTVHYEMNNVPLFRMADEVAEKIRDIHLHKPAGDVLVFMTGADDISRVVGLVENMELSNLVVLPAHGGVPPQDMEKIFQTFPGQRKVVVATNIAETSITIDGVVYVVDSGFIKQTYFDTATGIGGLDEVRHSQAGCNQRTGRCGRTQAGVCYRMYTQDDFNSRHSYTEPEIRRSGLSGVVLSMKAIGILDIEGFDFIDPPDPEALRGAHLTLVALGAIDADTEKLTPLGEEMASLPLEPRNARMLLEARRHGCVKEIATIVAFLSTKTAFARPRGKEHQADSAHQYFKIPSSDALTFLKVWDAYEESEYNQQWCYDNFLNSRNLWEIKKVRYQLLNVLSYKGIEISSSEDHDAVLFCYAAGLVQHLFKHTGFRGHHYISVMDAMKGTFIHPGSSTFHHLPQWMVANKLMTTSKCFAHGVSVVRTEWLPLLLPSYFAFDDDSATFDVLDGGETVEVTRNVVCKSYPLLSSGERLPAGPLELSFETAQTLYRKRVERLLAEECVVLRITESDPHDYKRYAVSLEDNQKYQVMGFYHPDEETGSLYYSRIKREPFLDDLDVAVLALRVIDVFEEHQDQEVGDNTVSIRDAAEQLQSALGSRL